MNDPVIEAARAARENAHCPYSHFAVGAAIETDGGEIFTGANVENASLGLTLCAERVALGTAVSAGARRFTRIVVVTGANRPTPPCGACRQVLSEFGDGLRVDAVTGSTSRSWRLAELLPDRFGPEDLAE